ncbi:TatD family hydrolase [Alcanivorax sp.]|jgi:TatD DNase family protein|uniref:TatD family hydrolase n=1 Tax=Alcanivorax sp. TaxID=1872427 RepID=UPI0032D96EDF
MSAATFVDSHCHLDRLNLDAHGGDFAAMMAATAKAGVSHMLCIGVDLETFPQVQALAEEHDNVFASVGVHPLYKESREPAVAELVERAAHPKVVAIGETGLDYFYAKEEREWQQRYFIAHILAARETGLPLVVHTRGAKEDTLALLREHGGGEVRGVLHCFTEDLDMALQAIELGFYISISGIVTFRNAEALRESVKQLPLERLLIETDSPWLAPVPFRGKPNEPRYVAQVAECVAELQGISLDALAAATADNFFSLFNKAQA